MTAPRLNGLREDARPLGDFRPMARRRANARAGSEMLRRAILRAMTPKPAPKAPKKRYGTWEERQLAASQIDRLQETVASYYGISKDLLTQPTRGPQWLSEKRQVAMYLARNVIQSSLPSIATKFGRKDHTTVLHACRVVANDPALKADIEALSARIRV